MEEEVISFNEKEIREKLEKYSHEELIETLIIYEKARIDSQNTILNLWKKNDPEKYLKYKKESGIN